MGGIFGTIGIDQLRSSELVRKMSEAMSHRGRDSEYVSAIPFSGGVVRHPWEADTKVVGSIDQGIIAVCEGEIYGSSGI